MQHAGDNNPATIQIDDVTYLTSTEVGLAVGVSRQTLWRWRQDGKIPAGRRYRDKQILFTRPEFETIRRYAHRIEPLALEDAGRDAQLGLFGEGGEGER